jgi:hypothetical protein
MSLVRDNELIEFNEIEFADGGAAMQEWQHLPASTISHHGERCCRIAREWVLSMDYSQLNASDTLTGPRWLRLKYKWGPSVWPIHWCEAVEQKALDCGALAAMAQEVFVSRGVRSYPAQLIQQYTEVATRHWRKTWLDGETSAHWIKQDLIYHEACAVVVRDNEIKIWDPSAGWWIKPEKSSGYGGLIAVRVFTRETEAHINFRLGAHVIAPNVWQKIARAW